MTNKTKKLQLNKETLRKLNQDEMSKVLGADDPPTIATHDPAEAGCTMTTMWKDDGKTKHP